ncbi:bifunctional DNA-formamidopyrimidine glycosylase/DNA-(apurinic or apyrimidinic site) lyase [Desulfobulbus rhabdoformis]|jgi:formamidopyrimidine-DNA glycosylase|uniref:bifunctional DNA-formamidopyrimidine glycosylase/DNA-(apurinic or apyrimidinic site) lyase n=1 Tax=Desulfobulbus rhabdoformis TaxID=34032 RepID=UPI001965C89F|nr:bifunctional DNA-formamidopyrimidine glycosylase/DNA-(apurinic or apyrimidinic site) lyase [Desulfobulbus rhabdoformis]MBM9615147.1 bifunctional DNA-formamidopyrimidine glycosylase/DNA-(apurinic or apyrimidinic site) lyase [Desulfobulbus rhabdoformis]
MPELPEVEVTRRGLLETLPGRLVQSVRCSKFRLRQSIPRALLKREIAGQQVVDVDRRAKYLFVRMSSGAVLVLHLGMTGKLTVIESKMPRHKHDHLTLVLDNGFELRFNDCRRFGSVAVWPAEQAAELEAAFSQAEGIEPFGPEFTAPNLLKMAKRRTIPVKSFLMNSKIIAGIGNIYANEILFATAIDPFQAVNTLSEKQWQSIVKAARKILQQAIESGGSSISDFLGTSGHPGYFQLQLQVYGRKGELCVHCETEICKTDISGRATYYCPSCQKSA